MEFDDYESLPSSNIRVHMGAGAVAGIFEHIVMYPVDSVKTRMQSLAPSPEASYRTIREGLTKMVTTEGLSQPVKGISAVILGAGPAHALYFSTYEGIKKKFSSNNTYVNDLVNAGAGCGATLAHDAIMVPADVVKQRLQIYKSPYSSCFHCVSQVYKTDGIRAFYRSYTTQLAMNIPNHAILIVMYEKMQKFLNPKKEYSPMAHCVAGATAGAVGAAVTTPLDVCKTLLNTQESSALSHMHSSRISGIQNACSTIYKLNGFRGFFKGVTARVLFQMPGTAIAWTVYEMFKHLLVVKEGTDCNPEQGNELLMDGVLGSGGSAAQEPQQIDSSSSVGWGTLVQEKKYGVSSAKTVDRLLQPLTASCSAQEDKLLVK